MKWRITKEVEPNRFTPTGEEYSDMNVPINEYLESLRAKYGVCHGAEMMAGEEDESTAG